VKVATPFACVYLAGQQKEQPGPPHDQSDCVMYAGYAWPNVFFGLTLPFYDALRPYK
jgi:hypothetical protein